MKKIGLIAALLALIFWIISRVRNEVTVEVDTEE
ncbi:hypothetical protein SEA_KARDASHIAN_41 [Streptomyces phage Kardashian]|nr:hypothetical protein SEA_KARDASHIAN_41 [Streptomyces phage Kardashian]